MRLMKMNGGYEMENAIYFTRDELCDLIFLAAVGNLEEKKLGVVSDKYAAIVDKVRGALRDFDTEWGDGDW